jgi:hypothetical protein
MASSSCPQLPSLPGGYDGCPLLFLPLVLPDHGAPRVLESRIISIFCGFVLMGRVFF